MGECSRPPKAVMIEYGPILHTKSTQILCFFIPAVIRHKQTEDTYKNRMYLATDSQKS